MTRISQTISGALAGAFSALQSAASGAWQWIVGAVQSLGATVGNIFSGIWGAIQGFFSDVADGFRNVTADGKQAFGMISEALQSGDLSTAWELTVALLRLEWARLVGWLTEKWLGFKAAWTAGTSWLESVWVDVTAKIQTVWMQMIGFLSKAWMDFANSGWSEWWANAIAPIVAKIQGVDVEDVRKNLAEDFARSRAAAPKAKADIDAQTAQQTKEIEDRRQARQTQIQESVNEAAAARQRQEQETQQAVNDARKKYADTIKETRQRLDNAEFDNWWNEFQNDVADELDQAAGRGGIDRDRMAEAKETTSGTFNPFAAYGMGGGGSAMERTAQNTERMADDSEEMVDLLEELNESFGFA
jgi:hypothetical protein